MVLFISHGLNENDDNKVKEIMSWLPNGDYESLEYKELQEQSESETKGSEIYSAYIAPIMKKKRNHLPLPMSFISSVKYFVLARHSGYSELKEDELAQKSRSENRIGSETNLSPIVIAFKTDDGRRVFQKLYHETVYLWIFAFDDVADLILNEKKSGVLTPEKKYREQDIFSFTPRSGGRFYLSPTHTNLLLVTREKKYLEAMIRTGLGEEESILDSAILSESMADIEILGRSWMISDISLRLRIQLEEEKKLGASSERINYLTNRMDIQGRIKKTYLEIGDQIVQKQVYYYLDEVTARKAHEERVKLFERQMQRASSREGESGEYALSVFGTMRCDIDRKTVIVSRFLDEKYFELEKAESLRRIRIAEKEAKKNRSKSK